MAFNVQALVGAAIYELHNGNPFWVVGMVGLGIPPNHRLKSRGALQHGATDDGYLADERILGLSLASIGTDRATADGHRDTLRAIFKPQQSTPTRIRVTREDGQVRQLDVHAAGPVDMPQTRDQRMGPLQLLLVQMEAAQPLWYDPALVNTVFLTVIGGTEGWQIPALMPWDQQGGDIINVRETFHYAGDAPAYPEIIITGPADNPVITNETTGETLTFTGSVPALDTWTVTISDNSADVTNAAGDSVLEYLSDDSDLGTFHLDPDLNGGDNDITVEILTGATGATRVRLRYYTRYFGL